MADSNATHPYAGANRARFVIFGEGRTGSDLLVSLLNSHPLFMCSPELLGPWRWRRWQRPVLWFWMILPYPYLHYNMAMSVRAQKWAYGFKLKPWHVVKPESVVRQLHDHHWAIIHIQRRSLFDQTMSVVVGRLTRRWHGKAGDAEPATQMAVDPAFFLNEMHDLRLQVERCDKCLETIRHLDVVYEDDLENPASWPATINRICAYLGIPPAPVRTQLAKPWSRPYSEMVTNYSELVQLGSG